MGIPETLAGVWLFKGISRRGLRELTSRSMQRRFAKDEVLFRAGSPARGLFVILEGQVRVVRGTTHGRQHVIHTEGPGGTLGEVPIFDGAGYPATAIAVRPTLCQVFTPEGIRAAFAADPDVAWAVARRLAARVRTLVDRLDARVTRPTVQRLAALLWATYDPASGTVRLDMTQHDIAEELGTVREVVVRDLRTLKHRGVIRPAGRRVYEVDSPSALRDAMNGRLDEM